MADQSVPNHNTTTTTTTNSGGGNTGIAFIVGVLVVAVAILAFVIFGDGGASTADNGGVNVTIESSEGAAEATGDAIEGAVEDTGAAIESAGDEIESATDEAVQ